ncbi:MAG: class I SAM-dependent methyltransferase, partial [Gammaproteobacteria bacterium]
ARRGHKILDLAGGTGDLSLKFARCVGKTGVVVLSDINSTMLEVGRDRLLDRGYSAPIACVQANAESLPFPSDYFDCISIGFGLRNVTRMDKALQEMFRCVKPGGRVLILEFSKPTHKWLNKLYDRYSFSILPRLGHWIAQDASSYQYLAESIRMHPDQDTLIKRLEETGFRRCHYYNLTGGIVAVHRAFKL